MSPSTLSLVLREADRLAGRDGLADGELVRRYAATRDEPAFAELLRRHAPLVWAACRHLLPSHADAEDAFQATFLALVRSAGSIRRGEAVGGWLHGVAVRAATKLRRAAARRKAREVRAATGEADRSPPGAAWDALLAAVHEEVARLPDALRTAFVLCDLEGVAQPDAAARLGWKPGTLTGRLCRARQLLLDRLAGRGLAPAVGVCAASVAGAAPAPLVERVEFLARGGVAVPPAVLELVREVTPMALNWTKRALAAALVAGGLGAAIFPVAHGQQFGGGEGGSGLGAPTGGGFGQPLVSRGGAGAPPGMTPGPAAGGGASVAARGAWEYKYVQQRRDVANFKQALAEQSAAGWEYCDHLEVERKAGSRPDEATDLLVFKRPTNRTGAGVAGGSGGMMVPGGQGTGLGGGPGIAPGRGATVPGSGPRPSAPGTGGSGSSGSGPGGLGSGAFGAGPGPGGTSGGAKSAPRVAGEELVVIRLKNAQAAELATVVGRVFARDDVELTADERTNSLIVRGTAARIDQVRALVERLDATDDGGRPSGRP